MPAIRTEFGVNSGIFYARTFTLVSLLLVAVLLAAVVRPLFAPIAWALFLAFLLHPLHARLVARTGGRANLSAALITFATFVLLLGPVTALVAAFAADATNLLKRIQEFAVAYKPTQPSDLAAIPVVAPIVGWIQDSFGVTEAQVYEWVADASRNFAKTLAVTGREAVLGAIGTVIGFIVMIYLLFFMVRDGRLLLGNLRALVPLSEIERARLFGHLGSVTRAVVYGSGVTALVQGALVGTGFAIAGLPSPVVFGVLAALLALLPLAGTPVVWVPGVLLLAAQGRWGAAIFLLGWGVFTATIDNVLRPLLAATRARVQTLTVFIGVLGGVSAFGVIGLILGPLVIALAIALLRFMVEQRQSYHASPIVGAADEAGIEERRIETPGVEPEK